MSGLGALLVVVELGCWPEMDEVTLVVTVEDEEFDAVCSSLGLMVKRWFQVTKAYVSLSSQRSK